ncbi:lipolytic protein G-D-S-L family [Pseudopedobacter saltans DSM 12145]|uniref:Lipolytic protein G-D-S-L family n=1 Tax=Pseudopedobacter saltans (strain ATCC 51119 / DSM 12145 / JCM 21818 / CCUG 39354 / LMG 10337 / NBRC 100064 / NCIMB 13643) TaxID=762903 RepID=F0SAI0_PSESL|nr:SGNH/GDSL hydrolase family protein [Pseudopedobacter saltans]ADY52600.1 lipolytic protein G-D-S-L family [Pseudopedobacter saltans DSM 12145]
MIKRRDFIKSGSLAGVLALSIPEIVQAAVTKPGNAKAIKISQDMTVLFQGDSITDAGRKKDTNEFNTPANLGTGYVNQAAAELLLNYATKNLKIYNKGISGNKVYQLAERWDNDCLSIKPDILSILIGVNDYWHKHNGKYDGTIETYRNDLKALLKRTVDALPNVKLVIGEPFAVKGIKAVDESWYPQFNEYRAVAKALAEEFNAVFIPYQKVFDEAQKQAPGVYWTHDGVHPSLAGAKLMAEAWLKAVQ